MKPICPVSCYLIAVFSFLYNSLFAQCAASRQFYDQLLTLENNAAVSAEVKLNQLLTLKDQYKTCRLAEDSVYARMLHRIGVLEWGAGKFSEAISITKQAVLINTNGKKSSNRYMAISSYYNLGYYYMAQSFYTEALNYYDSCIYSANGLTDSATIDRISYARQKKGYICHQIGDDQKDIEETTLGLKAAVHIGNSSLIVNLLNERAQAYASRQMTGRAIADLDQALSLISRDNYNAYADNYKLRAKTSEANNKNTEALTYYKKGIETRRKTGNSTELAKDYLDAGNFLRSISYANNETRKYYRQVLDLAHAGNNREIAGKALNNLGTISFRSKQYVNALEEYQQGISEIVPSFVAGNSLQNPPYNLCKTANKVFLYQLLSNKAECLLYLYKQTKDNRYLGSSLATALLTDSVITVMRHEQTEEQSKLHWLSDARDMFSNALEACYLAKDENLAFFFMEKSRSVLLNDKLNELGAHAFLPAAEASKEREFLMHVISEQQQLTRLKDGDPLYSVQEDRLLQAKENFDRYEKILQNNYPAYYQYKYADDVPSLQSLRKYLTGNQQCFVHYFIGDTCIYILAVTPGSGKMIRQPVPGNSELADFMKICSDKQALNRNYALFARLSNHLYTLLFKPLDLPCKRIIICNDIFLIPFEAFTADAPGKNFLVNKYAFSYVYSARSLMKNFDNPPGAGNCLQVVPASYALNLGVANLDQSQSSAEKTTSYYSNTKTLLQNEATRHNFLTQLPQYTIVNIYSHASADSTEAEPKLFMVDSAIRLSELQMLNKPATKLVVLSACQTSAGKGATGEGVYSLARGFAAAGIPSVATTLWMADEKAAYFMTEMFHQKISRGMRKDDALQQAKLAYIQQGDNEQLLPYYWANMILAGNGEVIKLPQRSGSRRWPYIFFAVVPVTGVIWFVRKRRRKLY